MMPEPYRVLFMDNHIIAALKAPGVLSQADKTGDPDMLTLIRAHVKDAYNKPGGVYIGLVHRLDRPVGGVMVFARTSKAAARLCEQIRRGSVERGYLAVCHGELKDGFTLTDWLKKDPQTNKVALTDAQTPGAKLAVTRCEPITCLNGRTLVSVWIETGRAHQIRAQMAARGHPVAGDTKYGHIYSGEPIALYARSLCFTHPTLGTRMAFEHTPVHGAFAAFTETTAQ